MVANCKNIYKPISNWIFNSGDTFVFIKFQIWFYKVKIFYKKVLQILFKAKLG